VKDREDPGLPLTFGPASNGEYDPEPIDDVRAAMLAAAHEDCETGRRVTGLSRRAFLRSAAATLATLWAIDDAATAAAGRPLGGGYPIARLGLEARRDPVTARILLGSGDFVFDMQGHLLEYDLDPSTPVAVGSGAVSFRRPAARSKTIPELASP
jgi:hypothetical protein